VLRAVFYCLFFALLGACGGPAEPIWAPDAEIQKYTYRHNGPPEITLFTVVNKRSGSGAHSGLLINSTERVLFDPAGSFKLPFAPERNDVHFGMTDRAVTVYIDYHARQTFDVIEQRLIVTPEQAALALSLVKSYGAVPKAQCSLSITRILGQIPGFETISTGYFPKRARAEFATLPGVRERTITDDDADKNHNVLITEGAG